MSKDELRTIRYYVGEREDTYTIYRIDVIGMIRYISAYKDERLAEFIVRTLNAFAQEEEGP